MGRWLHNITNVFNVTESFLKLVKMVNFMFVYWTTIKKLGKKHKQKKTKQKPQTNKKKDWEHKIPNCRELEHQAVIL